ncbi:type 4a pilus biogenesis protein PilO [Actinoplanes bogorensis]|uniref:Type 4a pilus biogenesis protein PilO n=1 Tax=Paractinoplanes bogorensis TaxID=1610840 RepID=A0ABS5Z7L6_9ACTN|nr:type 4a pilus biogenesis protein PilO [Actinoplanes bogorensis]MBU2670485.1 type 4a pilus biogenesis protein PilO [Actinoplanes bogorensis]
MDRIWLIGGIVAIVVIVAAAWLLAISPKFTEADTVQTGADDTTIQLTKLKKDVAALKEQDAKKATYQAELDKLLTNLPETYGMPVFLRSLQTTGDAVNVDVTVLSAGSALQSPTVPAVAEMPLSVNASGTAANVSKFLVQLQTIQPRAVLLEAISLAEEGNETATTSSPTSKVTATLTMTAFCTTTDVSGSASADRTDRCQIAS